MEGAVGVACCCACRGDGAGCISAFVVGQEAGKGIGQARATELSTPSTVDHRQFCSSVCPSGRIAATMGSGTNAHGSMATSLTYPRCPTRVEAMCPDHPTCARRAIWLRLLQSCFMWKVLGRFRQGAGAKMDKMGRFHQVLLQRLLPSGSSKGAAPSQTQTDVPHQKT